MRRFNQEINHTTRIHYFIEIASDMKYDKQERKEKTKRGEDASNQRK